MKTLFCFELKKLFHRRSLVLVTILLLLKLATCMLPPTPLHQGSETVYRQTCTQLSGAYSEEKLAWLNAERYRMQTTQIDSMSLESIDLVMEKLLYLGGLPASEAMIFDDWSWEIFLMRDSFDLLLFFALLLTIIPYFTMDSHDGISGMLRSMPRGIDTLRRTKLGCTMCFALLIGLLFAACELVCFGLQSGFANSGQSVRSIAGLANSCWDGSLLGFAIWRGLCRALWCLPVAAVMAASASLCRRSVLSAFICAVFILVPAYSASQNGWLLGVSMRDNFLLQLGNAEVLPTVCAYGLYLLAAVLCLRRADKTTR